MDIGEPREVREYWPLEIPVPGRRAAPAEPRVSPEPERRQAPLKTPQREPEKVPAGR